MARFGESTVSVSTLMSADKLVQLLETPIFISTRMHLTQPERPDHAHLLRSLYGLLMLMPQGTAYATLRDRLSSVTPLHLAIASPYHHYAAAARMGSAPSLAPMPPLLAQTASASPATVASTYAAVGGAPACASASGVTFVSPLDVDAAFSLFADSQRKHKEAVTAELRSRSVLHRYHALQQQQQQQQSAALSPAGAAGRLAAAASSSSSSAAAALTAGSLATAPLGGAGGSHADVPSAASASIVQSSDFDFPSVSVSALTGAGAGTVAGVAAAGDSGSSASSQATGASSIRSIRDEMLSADGTAGARLLPLGGSGGAPVDFPSLAGEDHGEAGPGESGAGVAGATDA